MKKWLSPLSIALAFFLLLAAQTPSQKALSANMVMQKAADKLASIKLLGYKYQFDYRYPSQDRSTQESANAFLDLKPLDPASQFRFQFRAADRFDAYNGAERFILDKTRKRLFVENKPSFNSFGIISLQNSPLSLKYALPRLIADSSISKKTSLVRVGNREQYLIEFSLPKGIINSAGEIMEIRPDQTNIYQLKIDKTTLLPIEVTQTNDKNDEVIKTTYSDMTERPAVPTADSWYFSTYQNEYTLQKKDKLTLIESGKMAPAFSLGGFANGQKISLSEHQGKLVLVEFWIAHCGFCIAAVPKLNAISEKFRDKGLQTVSVNMYDPPETIDLFKKKNRLEYTILTGGDSIATAYGVESFPAFVLVGKDGKVVYSSSGLDEKKLDEAITGNL